MTKAELLEALKGIPDDTEVLVYADHGQSLMRSTGAGFSHVYSLDDYEIEEVIDQEADISDCVPVFVIEG